MRGAVDFSALPVLPDCRRPVRRFISSRAQLGLLRRLRLLLLRGFSADFLLLGAFFGFSASFFGFFSSFFSRAPFFRQFLFLLLGELSSRPVSWPSASSRFSCRSFRRVRFALALSSSFALLQFFLALLLAFERDVRLLRRRRLGDLRRRLGAAAASAAAAPARARVPARAAAAGAAARPSAPRHVPDLGLDRHRLVVLPADADHQEGQQQGVHAHRQADRGPAVRFGRHR
jgi:hypothetical protein